MPGYKISRSTSKNPVLFDKYQCPYCNHLLKDAVQAECGHWLCQCCADELLAESSPKCPKVDCQEFLKSDKEEIYCFPDRFVRREIEMLTVSCPRQQDGCQWEGSLKKLEVHLSLCVCDFLPGEYNLTPDQIGSHGRFSHKALIRCKFAEFECRYIQTVSSSTKSSTQSIYAEWNIASYVEDFDDEDEEEVSPQSAKDSERVTYERVSDYSELAEKKAWKIELLERDKKISSLTHLLAETKKKALVERCTHTGTFEWKIPLFSRKVTYARSGFLFPSYPFYSRPMGYKMCLQLYILGDGSGRGTHMSLFFVIMKGEFDNILKWPFTSKVTFKLINQRGSRDISGTFQPDPKSSSFQKPTSDMNIASGCSRFMCHTELNEGGFIVDDVVFLQCLVDCS